jgi:hypothetical protein
VDGALENSDGSKKNIADALRLTDELLNGRKSDVHTVALGFSVAELSAASWQSAERTGALGHMEYSEVQKYSKVYGLQDLYTEHQRQTLERLAATAGFAGADPNLAALKDVETFRQQVLALRADLLVDEQVGRRLADVYRTALEH